MRKTILTVALAALTVGLLGSCSKLNDRMDDIDDRLNAIESGAVRLVTYVE